MIHLHIKNYQYLFALNYQLFFLCTVSQFTSRIKQKPCHTHLPYHTHSQNIKTSQENDS